MKATRIATLVAIVSTLMAGTSVGGYIFDTFDEYATGALDGKGQWTTSSNTVQVITGGNAFSTNSALIATDTSATNTISQVGPTKVWTDFRIRPMLGVEPTNNLPTASASMIMYFDSDGYVGIWTNGGFEVCSNSVWGDPITPLTASTYAEIGIYQNFTSETAVVFVNGVAVKQDIPFVSSQADYNYFVVQNVESNAWLDDVRVQTTYYADYHTTDSNGVHGVDAEEVDLYGYLGRDLYIDGGDQYYTFQDAIDVSRANDTLVVLAGSYAESFSVSNDIVLTGDDFYLTGNISVLDGGSLAMMGDVTVTGDVTVASTGSLTVTNNLEVDNLTLDGSLALTGSRTLTVNAVMDLTGGGTVDAASGSTIDALTLDMDNVAAKIVMDSGDLTESSHDINLNGTFTIYGEYWPGPSPVGLPFEDNFQIYAEGSQIGDYGFFGWYTADTNIKVVASGYTGQGLILPDGTTLSNRIQTVAGETNIWTTYYVKANRGVSPAEPETGAASFLGFVNTNGYMQVALTNDQWLVCSTNLGGGAATQMDTNAWTRVDIHVSIDADNNTGQFALFVDGFIVAQQQAFPGTVDDYTSLIAQSNDGDAWLDDIRISVDLPTGLTEDVDGNQLPDGYEIHQYGYIGRPGLGSLFKFR